MEGEEEKDESRHFGQQGFDKNKMCVFVPTGVHEINVLFLQMINNWKFHHHTGKCLTTHYLSLNAQEAYYMGVCLPHTGHHNGVEMRVLSDLHYTSGLCDSAGTAYIRQPCEPDSREPDRLLRQMNLGAVQGLREPPPLIWLVVAKCSGAT